MRMESAARAKGNLMGGHTNLIPEEGSRLRELYNQFMEHKAEPILPLFHGANLGASLNALRDFYGLDIRIFHEKRHSVRGAAHKRYWLVGEWFGKTYIDYVAARREREERELKQ